MAGMSLGAIVGLVMGVALEMILKHAKMLPAPIPRACDEIIDDDWVLELQPEQEDAVVVEAPPEIETVFKDMATKQQWSSPVNLKAKLVEIRDFILRYLWRREGFEVTIHCRNSFLYRSLRRKFVPEKLVYRVERKEDKTFIDEIEVVDYAEVYIVENGYATWMTAENNLTPWQMSCKTNGDELTLSFRLHKGLVIMIWVIAVIGFIVPLLLLTPALWIVPIFLLAILINGCLLKEIQKAQRVFTKRLRKIEAAYKKKVSSGK